ncbi:MAG TPA: DedA family protein/thiosulfate sulfurtransferase GlpE [Rhizomicrobium sp.]|nr:DedA family protein/thiosulfate sulfurtransferase GlpE [Rhizomicrobium sp.]
MRHVAFLLEQYGLVVVFLNVLLSQGGAPIPVWPVLLAAGALSVGAGAPWPEVLAASAAAAVLADMAWYVAGAHYGRRVLALLCKLSLSPDSCVRQTETVFGRYGPRALLFAKFVPGLGYITVALSGVTGVFLPTFLALDAIGAAVYFSIPILLGRIFHNAVDALLATLIQLGKYGVLVIAAALVVWLLVRWIERQAFIRQLRMARISVDELAQMIDGGKTPVILDVRPAEARAHEGMIPGAIAAHPNEIENVLKTYPRDVEVIIYCACPNEATAAVAANHLKRAGYRKIRPLLGGIDAWASAGRPIALPG